MHNGEFLLTSTDGFIFQSTVHMDVEPSISFFIHNIKII